MEQNFEFSEFSKFRSVLVLLKFSHFSPERVKTGSLGATESEI